MENKFKAPGYEKLADVLSRAFDQAAYGKGKERHANDEPFHEQVMLTGAQRFGSGALLFQAFKKSEESQRLPHDRAVAELLGAINYLAGAVISMESKRLIAANDNDRGIPWKGGNNPAPGMVVRFTRRFDSLHLDNSGKSESLNWYHDTAGINGNNNWIISYEVIGPHNG